MADEKKSNSRIRLGYGDLNRIEKPNIHKQFDPSDTTVMDTLKKVLENQYSHNSLDNVGQLKGIVLRVEPGKDNSAESIWASLPGFVTTPLKQLKVRVPELHAALPEPDLYGDVPYGPHQRIIDLYPTFTAVDEEASQQNYYPGDVVIVDFADRNNLTQPVFLRKFASGPGSAGELSSQNNGMYYPNRSTAYGHNSFKGSNGLYGDGSTSCVSKAKNKAGGVTNKVPTKSSQSSKKDAGLLPKNDESKSGGNLSKGSSASKISPNKTPGTLEQRARNIAAIIERETGISLSVRLLASFIKVESGGRRPTKDTIRFEPHLFLGKYTSTRIIKSLRLNTRPDLYGGPNYAQSDKIAYQTKYNTKSSQEWANNPNNRKKKLKGRDFFIDTNKTHTNRIAFERAYKLDPAQAIKSTSWGSFQVMGWALLEAYDNNPAKALQAYDSDPVVAGDMMIVSWFKKTFRKAPARKAFSSNPPDFRTCVRYYNGGAQIATYAPLLEKYYNQYSDISETNTSEPNNNPPTTGKNNSGVA